MITRASLVLALASFACARGARADDTVPNLYAGVVGGYTASVDQPENVPDPMGFAIGARAGLTLPTSDLYLGGLFLYHAGDSVSLGTAGAEVSSSSYMLGGEAGYELDLGPLVLRPSLGAGLYSRSQSVDGQVAGVNWESEDGESFYLSPGVNAMIALGILLGAELRYNAVLDDPPDSISMLAMIGIHL